MTKINLTDKYTTRDGREAKVFMIAETGDFPVIGAVRLSCGGVWIPECWRTSGRCCRTDSTASDLIPAKKKGELWLNIYPNSPFLHQTKEKAEISTTPAILARVRVTWEEGQFDE